MISVLTRESANRPQFGVLLTALLLLFVGTAFLDYTATYFHPALLAGLSSLLLAVTLIAAVMNVSTRSAGWKVRVIQILVGATVLSHIVSTQLDRPGLHAAPRIMGLLCFIYTITVVLGYLMRIKRVGADAINAAVCVFLLMGVSWALWYGLVGSFEEHAFSVSREEMQAGPGAGYLPIDLLYFSMVTLTTLGYGDVTPITTAARISAVLEATVGQIFMVVLVARLVGLNVAQAPPHD